MLRFFTQHALIRMRQRGKNPEGVKMVLRYGVRDANRDGVFMRKKDALREINRRKAWLARISGKKQKLQKAMRRRMRTLEQMRGCVVVQKDNRIITLYDRARRRRRRR